MDIIKSFTYMFKGKHWYYNIIIGSIIAFPLCFSETLLNLAGKAPFEAPYIMLSLLYGACSLVVGIFLSGFLCANANYRLNNKEENTINWSNLDIILLSGLKSFLANFIYKIPLFIILGLGLLATLTAMLDLTNINPGAYYSTSLKIVNALGYLIEIIIIPSFIIDLKLDSFFNFKRIGKLIKNNTSGFLILLVISLLVTLIYSICKTKFSIPTVLWIPVDCILTFYMILIKSDLISQFVQETDK